MNGKTIGCMIVRRELRQGREMKLDEVDGGGIFSRDFVPDGIQVDRGGAQVCLDVP